MQDVKIHSDSAAVTGTPMQLQSKAMQLERTSRKRLKGPGLDPRP